MEKKYQVFVSSTYDDLKEERLAAIGILLDNGCIPVGMEQFPASGLGVMEYIEKSLADCDYYILILAGRYGSMDSDGIGFTEKEFICAQEHSIPVLVFCHSNIEALPVSKCEGTDAGRQRLREFREKALKSTMAKMYSSVDDLKAQIATSINRAKTDSPREGWIRTSWATALGANSNPLQVSDVYQFETSGTFVSVMMEDVEQPLFLGDGSNVKIAISAKKDYEIKVSTDEDQVINIGLIPNISFFPSQLIPGQYSIHHSKLNINSNGGVILKDNNKCIVLQIVQTGSQLVEYEGRYAIYAKQAIPSDTALTLSKLNAEIRLLQEKVSRQPTIHVGTEVPKDLKTGEIFFELE